MSSTVHRRRSARQDVVDTFRYDARGAGFRVARRFLSQAEATFIRLAGMPRMGTQYEHDHPALTGMRYFPVSRFRKYLVFYRPVADGIEIIRILHGARDMDRFLAEDLGIEEDASDDEVIHE